MPFTFDDPRGVKESSRLTCEMNFLYYCKIKEGEEEEERNELLKELNEMMNQQR